jgi:hypothetical protein
MYTDAMFDTGCDTNTLASRELPGGILAVVATVIPWTDEECAKETVKDVPVGTVHSRPPAAKTAPREK